MSTSPAVVVVVPVHRNAATLAELHARLRDVFDPLTSGAWRLRMVVDACPENSAAVAQFLAVTDPRVGVTVLEHNVGQNAALTAGLLAEPDGQVWVVMDADLQDPPEAVPSLVQALHLEAALGPCSGVFGGRRGSYESPLRRVTGVAHRWVMCRVTGLPTDAGAFFAMDADLREAVLDAVLLRKAPSVVAAAGTSGLPLRSTPVTRAARLVGTSSWTHRARLRQAVRTTLWAVRDRRRRHLAIRSWRWGASSSSNDRTDAASSRRTACPQRV